MTVSETGLPASQGKADQQQVPDGDGDGNGTPAPAPAPVVAKADVETISSDSNKVKMFHEEPMLNDEKQGGRAEGEALNGDDDMQMGDGTSTSSLKSPSLQINGSSSSPDTFAGPSDAASDPNACKIRDQVVKADGGEDSEEKDDLSPAVQAVPLAEEVEITEEWWELKMTWSGKTFDMKVGGNDMVYDFRQLIFQLTGVPVEGQKLIGLLPGAKGKLGLEHDAKRFGHLGVKKGGKFVLVGTREEERFKDRAVPGNEVTDDFDVTYSNKAQPVANVLTQAEDPRNKRKVKEIIDKIPITVMNEPREGKRLLVLDLDYTIVDTKPLISGALPSDECARPGLHEFLEQVYPYYDIAIWSQTHWRWLETKLVELGMIGGTRNYKVAFVSDRTTMFPVFTQRDGRPYKHEVKPLAYFWAKFPHWSPKNTIHIDDLARNFALNPGEGLRIRAFNKAGQPEGYADRELPRLARYLINIANNVEDFSTVDHSVSWIQ
ncbi:HAD hydrolase, family IIID [Kwoniella heveanensis CBS 569]|nr:HAD hydrolase, family IIID [Kwoniella heveanensis CBS 569]